jgi:hypothetical protein
MEDGDANSASKTAVAISISSCWFARIQISFCGNAQRAGEGLIYTEGIFNPGNVLVIQLGPDRPGVSFAASGAPLVPGGRVSLRRDLVFVFLLLAFFYGVFVRLYFR